MLTRRLKNSAAVCRLQKEWRPKVEALEDRLMLDARFLTDDPAYVRPQVDNVDIKPLLTVAETVSRTADPAQQYRMVGIPDGLGAYTAQDGSVRLLMNHELNNTAFSSPVVGNTRVKGAFVSEYRLDAKTGEIVTGDLAYQLVFNGAEPNPIANVYNAGFGRFCSSHLAGPEVGFDRAIYLVGEEATGSGTFDGKGGQSVAIVGNAAYLLPEFGRFSWENQIVVPGTGNLTVVVGLEDGPSTLDSQLYMYVGQKDPSSSHPMIRNGLVGGKLYVFVAGGETGEDSFHKGDAPIKGTWVEMDPYQTDVELNNAAKQAGSFNFIRIEDGASDNTNGVFYFVTTGSDFKDGSGNFVNNLGRLYRLNFDPANPAGTTSSLTILMEGDKGDPIVNPDNMDINAAGEMMIQEDPNGDHRGTYLDPTNSNPPLRDSAIWHYDIPSGSVRMIADIDQGAVPDKPGYRAIAGTWETSGIIDVSAIYGPGSWLLDVQAHSLNTREASLLQGLKRGADVVEGGQLLLMKYSSDRSVPTLAAGIKPASIHDPVQAPLTSTSSFTVAATRPLWTLPLDEALSVVESSESTNHHFVASGVSSYPIDDLGLPPLFEHLIRNQ